MKVTRESSECYYRNLPTKALRMLLLLYVCVTSRRVCEREDDRRLSQ